MRILYFSRDYTTHDHRFLSALAKTEHKVFFLRLEQRGHQLEDRPLPPEIEQVHWSGGRTPANLWDGPRLLFDLRRVIRRIQPDLVQAGPLQRSALLAALSGFRPLVSMSWGYDLLQDAQRNSWWRWATRFTLKHSAAMVGDCNTIRQLAISYGMPDERIVTFPWGIDLKHFTPEANEETHTHNDRQAADKRPVFTLLSTRNWELIYGVEIIARAFVLAVQQCSSLPQCPELRLVMLGNGSQAGLLRRIFSSAGLMGDGSYEAESSQAPRVIFPGQVSYDDLPRYYCLAGLYVAATHSDGTSISLLEAMACGRPVLISDIPGNREWVTQGENGWLFPEGDAEALAQAIMHAIEQRDRLPEMGRAARRIAEQRADWEVNFRQLQKAYDLAFKNQYSNT
jgi:glycosyltransferase involved in cell wall biosynthesis